jgi:hypothetical protein
LFEALLQEAVIARNIGYVLNEPPSKPGGHFNGLIT